MKYVLGTPVFDMCITPASTPALSPTQRLILCISWNKKKQLVSYSAHIEICPINFFHRGPERGETENLARFQTCTPGGQWLVNDGSGMKAYLIKKLIIKYVLFGGSIAGWVFQNFLQNTRAVVKFFDSRISIKLGSHSFRYEGERKKNILFISRFVKCPFGSSPLSCSLAGMAQMSISL